MRLRIWRALKALGCAALRDGAYLLPLEHSPALESLGLEVREHGGTASVLTLSPKDEAQRLEIQTRTLHAKEEHDAGRRELVSGHCFQVGW